MLGAVEREREGRGGREMTCGSKDFFFYFSTDWIVTLMHMYNLRSKPLQNSAQGDLCLLLIVKGE